MDYIKIKDEQINKGAVSLLLIVTLIIIELGLLLLSGCFVSSVNGENEDKNMTGEQQSEFYSGTEETVDPFIELINSMTLREKIARLIIIGIEGQEKTTHLADYLEKYPFGGVIYFSRNIDSLEKLSNFSRNLQDLSRENFPLLICIDEEGGSVSRIPGANFPSAASMSLLSRQEIYQIGMEMALILREAGINMNLAPVLDLSAVPFNQVIGDRSFGADPEVVADHGTAMIEGLTDGGIIPVGKHFPGHGAAKEDSHFLLPLLEKDWEDLRNEDMVPFSKAVEKGIPAIMAGHLVVDDGLLLPATLSAEAVRVIRDELKFDGLLITDDLEMGALTDNFSWERIVTGSFSAGFDMLLIGHCEERQAEAVHILERAYFEGLFDEERLDASLLRILRLQKSIL